MVTADPILLNDWHVVAKVEDCPPGKIVTARLLSEDLVLWRPPDPHSPILVWQDYCPHRGVRLSLGEVCDRSLVCPYHGWQYDTAGKCVHIPAHPALQPPERARVKTYHCQERYGLVWVCLGNPSRDVVPFPEWDEPNYSKFWCGPYPCNASAFRLMDISVDLAHVPFVHRQSLGPSNPEIQEYQEQVDEDGVAVCERFLQHDSETNQLREQATSLTKVSSPLTVSVFSETKEGPYKGQQPFLLAMTPVEEEKSLMWAYVVTSLDKSLVPQWVEMLSQALQEDVRIVNSQRPARLPLLPPTDTGWPANLHVPSDRASVAYRKWLKELGVTYGVC